MPLLSLPNEILTLIAENLNLAKDTSSFLRTNHHLSHALTPHLHNLAAQDKNGLNALHWAASKGHEGLIKMLVQQKNFDIDALDNFLGQPPLHHAMHRRTPFSVRRLLVELGADFSIRTRDGREALHLAAQIGCEDTVKLLVERGARINSLDGRGQSVLYVAAFACSPSLIDFLLKSGADINTRNSDGQTVLHAAVGKGSIRICVAVVSLLLRSGVDVSIRSNTGLTARDHAANLRMDKIVELLDIETSPSQESEA